MMCAKNSSRLLGALLLGTSLFVALFLALRSPVRVTAALDAGSGDVVINEDAWMGSDASANDEWIELYNTTDQPITLTGWSLEASVNGPDILLSGTIPAHGYFLLERNDDNTVSDITADQLYGNDGSAWALGNSGEVLTLTDSLSNVIDVANGDGGAWPGGDNDPKLTMERIDPTAPDASANWGSNDGLTRNGLDALGNPINGTPKAQNSRFAVPGLSIAKSGPAYVTAGADLVCHIAVSNTGSLTVTTVVITDLLPSGLSFISQTATISFSHPASATLLWQVDELPPGARHDITLTLHLALGVTETVHNVVTATAAGGQQATASWSADVMPDLHIYAAHPYALYGSDEAVALLGAGAAPLAVGGWSLNDGGASFVTLPPTATLTPGVVTWLAEDADAFYLAFGFAPDYALTYTAHAVPLLSGKWPGFSNNGDEVLLYDDSARLVDALVYGSGASAQGWSGPSVPAHYAGYGDGQIIYRKLDQATGFPVPDTDTAADWAQDPDDPIDGRKLRYPGWDLEEFFFPAVATPTAPLTLAVAPDGSFDLVSRTLASAQRSIIIEGYTFESEALYNVIAARLQAGVTVTILLEGSPAGWAEYDRAVELWIMQQIHDHPNGAVYFLYGDETRYRYQHAKFIVVDDRVALLSTENFNTRGMPSDRKDNGTMGHRGFVVAVASPGIVSRLNLIFDRDLDLAHDDLVPYGTAPFIATPGFVPLPEPDWTTYSTPFSVTLPLTASDFTLLQSPENTLRDSDGLLGLIGRAGAGDAIAVMQMDEPYTWTDGVGAVGLNPRVQALLDAARRGAAVRLLLDAHYDDGSNTQSCVVVNDIAASEGLSLSCRLADVTGLGIHAKMFVLRVAGERWVNLGSVNGSENSNKNNREVALQFRSAAAYERVLAVFDHDWALGHGPFIYHTYLPLVLHDYLPPVDYPLFSEVFVNPAGDDTGYEWAEIYNPGPTVSIAGWRVGDAINVGDYGDGRYTFPAGAQLLHGQVIVVAACATTFSAEYGFNPNYEWTSCDPTVPDLTPVATWDGFGMALGNSSDEMLLQDGSGALVDSVAWGGLPRAGVLPYPLDGGDTFPWDGSLKRYPPDGDRDDCEHDFYISYNPSPGHVSAH